MPTYKGKFRPKNIEKYRGDSTKIVYRSLWERNAFRWADENPKIIRWSSEEDVIPYVCATDRKIHRYFIDLYLEFENGAKYMIEIKPESQTKPPRPRGNRKTSKFLNECLTYAKNESKWNAARQYCESRGIEFEVWTEKSLRALGIKIL
jgi:hypothetical protein